MQQQHEHHQQQRLYEQKGRRQLQVPATVETPPTVRMPQQQRSQKRQRGTSSREDQYNSKVDSDSKSRDSNNRGMPATSGTLHLQMANISNGMAGTFSIARAPTSATAWKQSTDEFPRNIQNDQKIRRVPKTAQISPTVVRIHLGNSSLLSANRLAENTSAPKFLLFSLLFCFFYVLHFSSFFFDPLSYELHKRPKTTFTAFSYRDHIVTFLTFSLW